MYSEITGKVSLSVILLTLFSPVVLQHSEKSNGIVFCEVYHKGNKLRNAHVGGTYTYIRLNVQQVSANFNKSEVMCHSHGYIYKNFDYRNLY